MRRPSKPLRCWPPALALIALLGGCCNVKPSTQDVTAWVSKEIPLGSLEADVEAFSRKHHFHYERDDPNYGQSFRPGEGCDWAKPIVQVEILYDENGRVKSTAVHEFSIGMP